MFECLEENGIDPPFSMKNLLHYEVGLTFVGHVLAQFLSSTKLLDVFVPIQSLPL